MKAYQEVCADLIIMLEDLEKSLEDITREIEPFKNQPVTNETEDNAILLKHKFDCASESNP